MSELRDKIREAAFNQRSKSKIVSYAGVEIELRQPSVGVVLGREGSSDRKALMSHMLINYCYVPGTDERVFDEADVEALMSMPFNSEWMAINEAIDSLTNLNEIRKDEVKN